MFEVDQTARLNSQFTADQQEDTRDAITKYREQEAATKARLGISSMTEDLKPGNAALVAALAAIKAAGAPDPVIVREVVANQGGNWEFDVYVFSKPLAPRIQVRSTEQYLAAAPASVIGDLKAAGVIA
jgi:hypothetical protein